MNNTTAVLKHNMYHKYTKKDFATEKNVIFTTNIYIFSTGDMITIHNVVKYYIFITRKVAKHICFAKNNIMKLLK